MLSILTAYVEPLSLNDIRGPTRRDGNPQIPRPEEGLGNDPTSHNRVVADIEDARVLPILGYALAHLSKANYTVLELESFPSNRKWDVRRMAEYAPADNEILWSVQLEKKQLARLERAKLPASTWLPKIDFVMRRQSA